jgi:hypothetical protein
LYLNDLCPLIIGDKFDKTKLSVAAKRIERKHIKPCELSRAMFSKD